METNDVKIFNQCIVCDEIFQDYGDLEKHNKIHVKVEKTDDVKSKDDFHQCGVCNKIFQQYDDLEKHNKIHIKDEKTDDVDENCHVHFEVRTVNYGCNLCDEKFQFETDLGEHSKIHVKKAYVSQNVSRKHETTSQGQIDLIGDVCSSSTCKSSNSNSDLKKHRRNRTGEKAYKCDVCSKSFRQVVQLERHVRTHTAVKPHECDLCGKSFKQIGYLEFHRRTHTGDIEKPFKCDVCGKSFTHLGNLTRHLNKKHAGVTNFKCDVCESRFSTKKTLKSHKKSHIEQRVYECHVCNKTFSKPRNLLIHIRLHTGEKPFKCDVCGKSFTYKLQLKKHQDLDCKDKDASRYQCSFCDKIYIVHSLYQKHLIISHKCDVCGQYFKDGDLQEHRKIHRRENAFKCHLCEEGFEWKSDLLNHISMHKYKAKQSMNKDTQANV